uniref:Uncharacterized protein n=1 Tax=Rhizophora mucronata TaxID=61149 RepID=A0A2P2QXC7_RHIMU
MTKDIHIIKTTQKWNST